MKANNFLPSKTISRSIALSIFFLTTFLQTSRAAGISAPAPDDCGFLFYAVAGPDEYICTYDVVFLYGSHRTNFLNDFEILSITWVTEGDGLFLNAHDLNTIYYPGSSEVITGLATLYLQIEVHTDFGFDCTATDQKIIYISETIKRVYSDVDNDGFGVTTNYVEANCDGFVPAGYVIKPGDCDDADATVYPGAPEVCDFVDQNCNGTSADLDVTWYLDDDRDGYGLSNFTYITCMDMSPEYSLTSGDCNDANAAIHPNAGEICGDGVDNDCDGLVDNDDEIDIIPAWFADADGDAFGDINNMLQDCMQPAGFVANNLDCNDNNAAIFPDAGPEFCNGFDDDCDGDIDEGFVYSNYYYDADGDTYGDVNFLISWCEQFIGFVLIADDCDDANAVVHPGAAEICDGLDNNCNTIIDEGDAHVFFADADADGFGDAAHQFESVCEEPPAGFVFDNTDCDDTNPLAYPGETWGSRCDEYNGFDDDCDGSIDEDGMLAWYVDADGDGYGDPEDTHPVYSNCADVPGHVNNNIDCDDSDGEFNPGTAEICNTMDDNCNGEVDEFLEIEWHADIDNDGAGNFAITVFLCSYPDPAIYIYEHWVENALDCYDEEPLARPGFPELCDDGIDNNCDGLFDLNVNYFYRDLDGDMFGDESTAECTVNHRYQEGWVMDEDMYGFDCDDDNAAIPIFNGGEICNGLDDDCNGIIDDGLETGVYYYDGDDDSWGDNAHTGEFCSEEVAYIFGYKFQANDCDDTNPTVYPFADEICDGVDNDCDFEIDEGFNTVWFADIDHDGYGNFAITAISCEYPDPAIFIYDTWVHNNKDCHDENPLSHPGAIEYCDGEDNNCNSVVDETAGSFILYADLDNDLYIDYNNTWTDCFHLPATGNYITENMSDGSDCNDNDPEIPRFFIPDEVCNGLDDDCDGLIDEELIDATIYSAGATEICQGSTAFLYTTTFSTNYQWYKNNIAIPSTNQSFLILTEPGDYSLQITQTTDEGTCSARSNTITITTKPLPVAFARVQGSNNLCGRTRVKLRATTCTGCSYQWQKGGVNITGAISANYNATAAGTYTVKVTGDNGCSATSNAVTVIKTCKEGEEEELLVDDEILIYPNPASENITVSVQFFDIDEAEATVLMYNMLGEEMLQEKVKINDGMLLHEINLENRFANGMYFIKIMVADKEITRQIVVNKE